MRSLAFTKWKGGERGKTLSFFLLLYQCFQDYPICSPEKESCLTNQTLKDESCLVPCSGLYTDIKDDIESLKQTMHGLQQNVIYKIEKSVEVNVTINIYITIPQT